MQEKIPGVVRSNKLRIIQLLEADLDQVLCIVFARNISKIAKNNKGIISDHQYGRAHATFMTPVLNKCTGFGVSNKTYGSTTEKLLYGIC
jgi:hypothetical protein